MMDYFLAGLILTTIFVFLECYAHELIYEDGAYKTPFNILGSIWGIYIFFLILERAGYL